MGRFGLFVLGIAAYALFLMALLPASFVAARIERATEGAVQLNDATGTLWRGAARVVVATPAGPFAVERLQWIFQPLQLARGRAVYQLSGAAKDFRMGGEMGRSFGGWEIPLLNVTGSAAGTSSFLPLLAPWRPEGELALDVSDLRLEGGALLGKARAEWRNASLAISEVRPLGTYRVDLAGEGGPARVTLSTLKGPLQVSAQGTLAPPTRIVLKGEARAEAAFAEKLQPVLDLFGPRRPDGARSIELVANAP